MAIQYKQKCKRCYKNYVLTTWRDKYPVCYDCQKDDMNKEITDPEFKKFFDIPEEFYKQNTFLRNIKIGYLRYGKLSDLQKAAFLKTVDKMSAPPKK